MMPPKPSSPGPVTGEVRLQRVERDDRAGVLRDGRDPPANLDAHKWNRSPRSAHGAITGATPAVVSRSYHPTAIDSSNGTQTSATPRICWSGKSRLQARATRKWLNLHKFGALDPDLNLRLATPGS